MATIVNNPPPPERSGNPVTIIITLIILLVLLYLGFIYGFPILRQMQIPQITIPNKIDVNVHQSK